MSMNSEGRVTRPETTAGTEAPRTFTGNRALMLE
jgi:glycine dehydrogenase subunit 2